MRVSVKCDKPYDLDAADKRRGKPRRRREDSRSTAYELTIRLNEEQRSLLGGKPKFVKVVYATNKSRDLAAQQRRFVESIEQKLREAAREAGMVVDGEKVTVDYVIDAYLRSKELTATKHTVKEGYELARRYVSPTIGGKLFDDLSLRDIEEALNKIPLLSRELNEAKRQREIKHRAAKRAHQMNGGDASKTHHVDFRPVREAGGPTQHKVLSLLREAGGYAVDMGLAERNAASSRRLSKQFPKNKPLVDNWSIEEIKMIASEIERLPLGSCKVQLRVMMTCGLRPCELNSIRFQDYARAPDGRPFLHIVNKTKTSNGIRALCIDEGTAELIEKWEASRVAFAKAIGIVFSKSWFVCDDFGEQPCYNTLKQRWAYFLERVGLEHRRPYSLRHTFATQNARNVDARTLAGQMGHASPGFTLSTYSGYLEQESYPVIGNYASILDSPDAVN